MKINICDVCYYQDKKTERSKYKAGFTHHTKIDLCEKHKNWHEQFKTYQEFAKGFLEIMSS